MPSQPRPSATVLVMRESGGGPEVLMLRRHRASGFAAGAWVFPGGTVDDHDRGLEATRWTGVDPDAQSVRLQADRELVLGLHVAAVRETFEEAGLLLATHADGSPVDLDHPDVRAMRHRLAAREARAGAFAGWLRDEELVADLGRLAPWSRWITPLHEPRRYDTWFFVAVAPPEQVADHDCIETTAQRWIRPSVACAAQEAGDFFMIYPTVRTLEQLAAYDTVEAVIAAARARHHLDPVLPHFQRLAGGEVRVLHPDHPGFPHDLYAGELPDPQVAR